MKVLVGMSGGVDSSTAAFLLREAGHEVIGISLLLFEARGRRDPTSCCSMEAIGGAERTARHIGIPHLTLNARDEFIRLVIEPFVESYNSGLTPNPCVLCNRHVKFPLLLRKAKEMGADCIATGHYARAERMGGGSFLKKGVDPGKDQSYFLYALRPEELERLLLPLGGYTKKQVREIARIAGLPVFALPESQEICFIEGSDYASFLCALNPGTGAPGPIKDETGNVVGTHRGIQRYTVGQRRGLGIASPRPLYVTGIDVKENTVLVGPRESAMMKEFAAGCLNWLALHGLKFRANVKVRSTMKEVPAQVTVRGDEALVLFDQPQFAPAPGQAAVFYDGETVIGGGTIAQRKP